MGDLASSRDWLFCPLTGDLLDISPENGTMTSPASKYVRRLDGTQEKALLLKIIPMGSVFEPCAATDLADVKTEVTCNMEVGHAGRCRSGLLVAAQGQSYA